MASAETLSRSASSMVRARVSAAMSIWLLTTGAASATEPPVVAEYRSAFAGYRRFDAQAQSVEWRVANDAIRDGDAAVTDGHGMHDVPAAKAEDHPEGHE